MGIKMFLDTFFFLQLLERERNPSPKDAPRLAGVAFLLALGTERTAQVPAFVTHIIKV